MYKMQKKCRLRNYTLIVALFLFFLQPVSYAINENFSDYSSIEFTDITKLFYDKGLDNIYATGVPSRHEILIFAAEKGFTDILKELFEKGALIDIDKINNIGMTALMEGAKNGHVDTTKLLLDYGAKIDLQNNDGNTALMLAAKIKYSDSPDLKRYLKSSRDPVLIISELLLKSGANPDFKNKQGNTALIIAVENNNLELVKILIKYQAIVGIRNNYGKTALMLAFENGRTGIIKALLNSEEKEIVEFVREQATQERLTKELMWDVINDIKEEVVLRKTLELLNEYHEDYQLSTKELSEVLIGKIPFKNKNGDIEFIGAEEEKCWRSSENCFGRPLFPGGPGECPKPVCATTDYCGWYPYHVEFGVIAFGMSDEGEDGLVCSRSFKVSDLQPCTKKQYCEAPDRPHWNGDGVVVSVEEYCKDDEINHTEIIRQYESKDNGVDFIGGTDQYTTLGNQENKKELIKEKWRELTVDSGELLISFVPVIGPPISVAFSQLVKGEFDAKNLLEGFAWDGADLAGVGFLKKIKNIEKVATTTSKVISKIEIAKSSGWKIGEDIYKLTAKGTEPVWRTVKNRFWKNKAIKLTPDEIGELEKLRTGNIERMKQGKPPQRINKDKKDKLGVEGRESKELHHTPKPKREGGKEIIDLWPQEHAMVDEFRHPGY